MENGQTVKQTRKSGEEHFHHEGRPIGAKLLQFWQWCASDLVSNTARGVLAEYIVALAIGGPFEPCRREWDAYDLRMEDGTKIEVKSAAYVQAWKQERPSAIVYNVAKRRWWDAETGVYAGGEPARCADVYVFALLKHRDRDSLDPLDLAQWEFYVLATTVLNERERSQHSITLASLQSLTGDPIRFDKLGEAIRVAANA